MTGGWFIYVYYCYIHINGHHFFWFIDVRNSPTQIFGKTWKAWLSIKKAGQGKKWKVFPQVKTQIRQTHPVTFVNVAEKKTGIAFGSLSAEADWAVIETLCELPYLYPTRLSSTLLSELPTSLGESDHTFTFFWKLDGSRTLWCFWSSFAVFQCFSRVFVSCQESVERFFFDFKKTWPERLATHGFGLVHQWWHWWRSFPDASFGHCHPGNLGILSAPWQIPPSVVKPFCTYISYILVSSGPFKESVMTQEIFLEAKFETHF